MKINLTTWAILLGWPLLASMPLKAALKTFPIENRLTLIRDGHTSYEHRTQAYAFWAEVLSDEGGVKGEEQKNGRPFITARKGERYALRLHNPLPVRVAVNLTVDGLNTITGKPSGIADGDKWILEPYSYITLRGWQVNGGELRRFFFTDKPASYAEWRGDVLGKDLSANCGVIGAAFFWSKRELQDYFDRHPMYVTTPRPCCPWSWGCRKEADSLQGRSRRGINSASEGMVEEQEAGTGMGEKESHPIQWVDFHYDTGMYTLSQALVVYYDFQKPPQPNPFPNVSYAPEMPF
ncbi:MAG: hypothetical protein LHV69_04875 [Elusimicrobia bacterium]|nr:hypothetical protein [Candidatus Obscuribacterium magneticum]MCB4756356.1 hypothetical protein [Candidatus Obscuribacterium magneticum]